MSYKTGSMGVAEGASLVFISLLPRITIDSFSVVLAQQAQISWLYILINGVSALLMASLFVYIHKKVNGDVYTIAVTLLGKKAACMMMVLLIIIFGGNAALLIRQYAENTLITAMPGMDVKVSILIYSISALFVSYIGIGSITRCSILFTPLLILSFIGVTVLLYPYYIPYQLLPWQGNGLGLCMIQGMKGVGYNVGFLAVCILASAFQNTKTIQKIFIQSITTSVLLKIYVMTVIIMVFGVEVGSEKTIPFFELARLIYLGRFFQHLEAFFIVIWVIMGALAIAINFYIVNYLLGRLLNLPVMRPIMPCMAMLLCNLALLPDNINQALMIDNDFVIVDDLAIYGAPIILMIAFWKKQGMRIKWAKST